MTNATLAGKAVDNYQRFRAAKLKSKAKPEVEPRIKRSQVHQELPERAQHCGFIDRPTDHAGIIGRQAQPPIDRLYARKDISPRMHSAGQMLRRDYELGVHGAKDGGSTNLDIRIVTASHGLSMGERQLQALSDYKAAVRALGPILAEVAIPFCCEEQDMATVASRLHRNRQEVAGVVKASLKTLARHYRLSGSDEGY